MNVVNNQEAFELYQNANSAIRRSASQVEKISRTVKVFINKYSLKNKDMNCKKLLFVKFKRLLENKPKPRSKAEVVESWKAAVFHKSTNPQGRPRKSLGDKPCAKRSRNLWTPMIREFENFATSNGLTNHEALNLFVKECNEVWKTKKSKNEKELPEMEATALIYNANLSRGQYQIIMQACLPYGIVFPVRKKIDALRSTLHPPITSQEVKVSVEMDELLGQTMTAIIKISQHHPKVGATYTLSGKFGIDGSGAHKVRQQLVDSTNAALENLLC